MPRALPEAVYHLAEAANWPRIRRQGLLSASALLDRAGLSGEQREPYESLMRPGLTRLPGGALIRDQNPMPPDCLARCLVGLTPAEWYRLMNARVFFCLDLVRLTGLLRACSSRPQVVLALSSARLVERHAERMSLSPINSGYARRAAARRGRFTFVPYAEWLAHGWGEGRPASHPPAELTVEGAVPDVRGCLIGAYPVAAGEAFTPPPGPPPEPPGRPRSGRSGTASRRSARPPEP